MTATLLAGSVFNTLLYLLPPLAGTVVDRWGFRKSLALCFSIFCLGYFMIGLAGLPVGRPLVAALGGPTVYTAVALVITAVGGSLIKPSIVGTVARTTTSGSKGLGYSIYYMLVNIGGAVGPFLAVPVRQNLGIAWVLVMSSGVSLALILATLLLYREPPRPADAPPPSSFTKVLADMVKVFRNGRFMAFLVVFSGFWAMFWQVFDSLPFYVRDVLKFDRFEIVETFDAWTIILTTVLLTALAKKLKPMAAMTLGFAIASLSWFVMVFPLPGFLYRFVWPVAFVMNLVLRFLALVGLPVSPVEVTPAIAPAALALILFAFGEGLQAPRYYEYVADLAPANQLGTYMGYAFLPIAIGTFLSGIIAGALVKHYVEGYTKGLVSRPQTMWLIVGGIGLLSTALMLLYDRLLAPKGVSSGGAG